MAEGTDRAGVERVALTATATAQLAAVPVLCRPARVEAAARDCPGGASRPRAACGLSR
jgi:hypothetical protein